MVARFFQNIDWSAWRDWPGMLKKLWRGSLKLRSITLAALLSSIAIFGIFAMISVGISGALFDTRLDQSLSENRRATIDVQQLVDGATRTDEVGLTALIPQIKSRAEISAPGAVGRVALLRTAGQDTQTTIQDIFSPAVGDGVISDELRELVSQGGGDQFYQSVTLGGGDPAIVVGTSIQIHSAGQYELFTVFDLGDVKESLDVIQQTLFLSGLLLVLLIVAVTWFVVNMTVSPIRTVAATSLKFSQGLLQERIEVKGEDELATLGRSFNQMASNIEDQINQLAQLSQLQQRFVSDVSHELRTPLTTIRLAGEVIYSSREKLPENSRRAAELLHGQVHRFETLLNDLLEMSRIDAGAVQLELEPVSVVKMVEAVIESVESVAKQQGSDVRLVAVGGYLEAELDPRRISRIIRNLLENAIEHGDGKPIVVSVDSNESAVAIAVRDYGQGVEEKAQARVFDRFWRADPSRRRTLGGTGLGLAISLEDTNLHHGWLDLWSQQGEGSYFRLTLPRDPSQSLTVSPLPLPPDDSEDITEQLKKEEE